MRFRCHVLVFRPAVLAAMPRALTDADQGENAAKH
jgi:hypothetical protein